MLRALILCPYLPFYASAFVTATTCQAYGYKPLTDFLYEALFLYSYDRIRPRQNAFHLTLFEVNHYEPEQSSCR